MGIKNSTCNGKRNEYMETITNSRTRLNVRVGMIRRGKLKASKSVLFFLVSSHEPLYTTPGTGPRVVNVLRPDARRSSTVRLSRPQGLWSTPLRKLCFDIPSLHSLPRVLAPHTDLEYRGR